MTSEIRKSYFFNKYAIITPGRAKRPRDVQEETIIKRHKDCPFCPENLNKKAIIDKIQHKKDKRWSVASIKNIFPAVSSNNKKAYGYQEVIIETPQHSKELADLPEKHIADLLDMYAKRTKKLSRDKKINYILCFKNQGSKAGASMVHSHSQIFATEITPPDLIEEANETQSYYNKNKRCGYCDIIKKEKNSRRSIFSDKNITAFCPYASEYHYEAWIFSNRHVDNISCLNRAEIKSLAKAIKKITQKLKAIGLSYNFFTHNVISDPNQHFYIKIQPRDSVWAGVELGSGLVINSISPETAAKYYNK